MREYLKKIGLIKDGSVRDKDKENVSLFLNRILALKIDEQEIVFGKFIETLNEIIEQHKEAGTYDSGIEDLPLENTTVVSKFKFGELTISKIEGYEPTSPVPFSMPLRRLNSRSGRIFVHNETGRICLMRDPYSTYNIGGRYERNYRVSCPENYRYGIVSTEELEDHYTELDIDEIDKIEQLWNEQLKQVPPKQKHQYFIMSGNIMKQWNEIKSELNKIRIVRVGEGKNRIVGVLVPDNVARIFESKAKSQKGDLFEAIMVQGKVVVVDGVTLSRRYINRQYVCTVSHYSNIFNKDIVDRTIIRNTFVRYLDPQKCKEILTSLSKLQPDEPEPTEQSITNTEEIVPLDLRPFKSPESEKDENLADETSTDETSTDENLTDKIIKTPKFPTCSTPTLVAVEQLNLF